MSIFAEPQCISCSLEPALENCLPATHGTVEVYYAETQNFNFFYPKLYNLISDAEKLKASKIVPSQIKETYIVSHAILRLYLARYLNINPQEIIFNYSQHAKPWIENNPVYFNLSHTNESFAFAISALCYVGIDIENIDRKLDIQSIVNSFFSESEKEFIFESDVYKETRFFLLWTRKESFLKALGTGIIDELGRIEVSGKKNLIKRNAIDNLISGKISNDHYIFSTRHLDRLISVTVPINPGINLNHITRTDVTSLLSDRLP